MKKLKSIKSLHKKAWSLWSLWIRSKDADFAGFTKCYTCGQAKHYKEMNAGHYIHNRLDFDIRNIKVQCVKCNQYFSGRLDNYTLNLIRDFGLPWVHQLRKDAAQHKGYKRADLEEIINRFKK